jgi:RNA polymerase primary sigma factor
MGFVINLKADTGLVDRSENTTRFYKDIKDFETFDREDEIKWFTLMKEGTPEEKKHARDHIINCNQRLVVAAAKNYATTENLTDYINEANFGLMEAVDKFDPTRGTKFASYAMWFILRAINIYKYDVSQPIKKTNYSKTFHVISKARNKFMQDNERTPSDDELLEIVNDVYGKDIKDKNDLLDTYMTSIDTEMDDEETTSYGDITDYNRASASYNEYEVESSGDYNSKLVDSLLEILKPREREIIKMRFGLYDDNGLRREYELNEIAEKIGITPERVRQLEISALKQLRAEYGSRINDIL